MEIGADDISFWKFQVPFLDSFFRKYIFTLFRIYFSDILFRKFPMRFLEIIIIFSEIRILFFGNYVSEIITTYFSGTDVRYRTVSHRTVPYRTTGTVMNGTVPKIYNPCKV